MIAVFILLLYYSLFCFMHYTVGEFSLCLKTRNGLEKKDWPETCIINNKGSNTFTTVLNKVAMIAKTMLLKFSTSFRSRV